MSARRKPVDETKTRARVAVDAGVRVDAYAIVTRAVEEGVAVGYRRAHKHDDKPAEDLIREKVYDAVMESLCEVLRFGDAS